MQHRVCICCGQPIAERGDYRSRHSHVCAACSAMADEEEVSYRAKKKSPLWRVHPAAMDPRHANPGLEPRRARLR